MNTLKRVKNPNVRNRVWTDLLKFALYQQLEFSEGELYDVFHRSNYEYGGVHQKVERGFRGQKRNQKEIRRTSKRRIREITEPMRVLRNQTEQ